jgi:hypothetical protein
MNRANTEKVSFYLHLHGKHFTAQQYLPKTQSIGIAPDERLLLGLRLSENAAIVLPTPILPRWKQA